jgi:hypothetical protein
MLNILFLLKRLYLHGSDVEEAFGFGSPTLGDAALGAEPLGTESLWPEPTQARAHQGPSYRANEVLMPTRMIC